MSYPDIDFRKAIIVAIKKNMEVIRNPRTGVRHKLGHKVGVVIIKEKVGVQTMTLILSQDHIGQLILKNSGPPIILMQTLQNANMVDPTIISIRILQDENHFRSYLVLKKRNDQQHTAIPLDNLFIALAVYLELKNKGLNIPLEIDAQLLNNDIVVNINNPPAQDNSLAARLGRRNIDDLFGRRNSPL